ncbi:MAG: DUF4102 domain-containing protein [Pseudomonadales bacterium]|nr:DUF4102 domain-containing protein [Pseudomonadales bacterium]
MSKIKLTTAALKKLEPKDKLYRVYDSEIAGFHVIVAKTERITFKYSYRIDGRSMESKIGVWPIHSLMDPYAYAIN